MVIGSGDKAVQSGIITVRARIKLHLTCYLTMRMVIRVPYGLKMELGRDSLGLEGIIQDTEGPSLNTRHKHAI